MADLAAALEAAAAAGDFFRLAIDPTGPGWRPLDDLLDRSAVLAERVAVGRATLARFAGVPTEQVELRPAASVVFLGLAARLTAPVLGAAVLTGTVPMPEVRLMRWRPAPNGSTEFGISSDPPSGRGREGVAVDCAGDPDRAASLVACWLREGPVDRLTEAFRAEFRISRRLLLGNVASGVGGAVSMLTATTRTTTTRTATRTSADFGPVAADSFGRRLLALPPLAGTVQPSGEGPGSVLGRPGRRLSCCLYYRLPGAGLCADCVLNRVPRPSR